MYLYNIDVVHSSPFEEICCLTWSLGPSLFLLYALPGNNSWMPPTLGLCNIQNDLA